MHTSLIDTRVRFSMSSNGRRDALATTVYVGGLPPQTDAAKLTAAFAPPFTVVHAVPIRCFGFVTFATADEARQAVEQHLAQIGGHPIHAALSHSRYRSMADRAAGTDGEQQQQQKQRAGRSGAVFVRFPPSRRQQPAHLVQRELATACNPLVSETPKIFVPRKQGGGNHHRGFAFVGCQSAADAAALLAGLQGAEWTAEMVRKHSKGRGNKKHHSRHRKGGGGKGRANHQRRAGGAKQGSQPAGEAEDFYPSDFESDDAAEEADDGDVTEAAAAAFGRMAGPGTGAEPSTQLDDDDDDPVDEDGEDACIRAMASFVSESREWALGVQGFLVDHCRRFEDTEENKLEWYELHRQLVSLMESLLEAELAKLGVGVDDFVERLRSSPQSKSGNDLLESVLAMDNYEQFKAMMLRLKDDLDLVNLPQDTLDRFASSETTAGPKASTWM